MKMQSSFKNLLRIIIIFGGVNMASAANEVCFPPNNGGSPLQIDVKETKTEASGKKMYTCIYTNPVVDLVGETAFNLKCPAGLEMGVPGYSPGTGATKQSTKIVDFIPKLVSDGTEQLDLTVNFSPLVGKALFRFSVFVVCRP
jgi:hypothetical protein